MKRPRLTPRGGRARLLLATLALLVVATGCAPDEGAGPAGDAVATPGATPAGGGTLELILGKSPGRGLDPAVLNALTPSGEANYMPAIYGMLMWIQADTGEVHPGIAESLEPNDDGSVWTLTLRPDVTFTDGTPFDAEAVKYNYERHQDPATNSRVAGAVEGLTFEVVDELTLEITLPEPNLQFDKTLALNLPYIGSPTAIQADPEGFTNNPVGAGPFMIEEWVPDDHMTLVRNPDFWQEGRPDLDEVVIRAIPDPNQRIQTVASGEAQVAVPGSEIALLDKGEESGLEAASAQFNGGTMLLFNTRQAPFDDVRARQAVAYALDPQELVDVADGGSQAVGVRSLFSDSSPFYDAARQFPAADPERAQALLDEIAAEGEPLSLTFMVPQSGFFRRVGEYVQSRLSQLDNINVEVQVADNSTVATRVFAERNYQMSVFISNSADPEPGLYNLLHTGGRDNNSQYSNPEVDAALEAARATTDEAARAEAYATMEQQVIADVPLWPFKNALSFTLHSPEVTGITLHSEGAIKWDRIGLAQ